MHTPPLRRTPAESVCWAVYLLSASVLRGAPGWAQSNAAPAVTPYRPSVSTPAPLSAPGWLEAELGGALSHNDIEARDSIPYALKFAFNPDWGIRVAGDALVRTGNTSAGTHYVLGDTALVFKRRVVLGADGTLGALTNAAFGLEGGLIALGHGSGATTYTLNTIFSADEAAWHADVNLSETRLAHADESSSPWQGGWAIAVSRNVGQRAGIVGEFSGSIQRGVSGNAQFLLAGSYRLGGGSVVDFGAARGLQRAAPSAQLFAGITWMLAQLW